MAETNLPVRKTDADRWQAVCRWQRIQMNMGLMVERWRQVTEPIRRAKVALLLLGQAVKPLFDEIKLT